MSVVQSHIITIFFAGCVGFCISFIVRKREKRAQEELLRFATIVQHSDDAIISAELDGTVPLKRQPGRRLRIDGTHRRVRNGNQQLGLR
jgi:hypothetical protein